MEHSTNIPFTQPNELDCMFPSFAASPNHSPARPLQNHIDNSVTKITIQLP